MNVILDKAFWLGFRLLFYYKTSLRVHFLKKFFDEQPVYDTSGTNITGKLKKIMEKTVHNMVRII